MLSPPLPTITSGSRPGLVYCGSKEVVDCTSWDRLGLLNGEASRKILFEAFKSEPLVDARARKNFEPSDFKTIFERSL